MSEYAIELKNVSKTFYVNKKKLTTVKEKLESILKKNKSNEFIAVNNINLKIKKGENFGVIGRNGSGKSTLLKLMSGAFIPDKGSEIIKNGTSILLNLGVGISHELTVRENIYIVGSILGIRIVDIEKIFDDIIEFAELENFVETKIKHLSTGMVQRLSFSIAQNVSVDIMFLDEIFAVGDSKFKKKATAVFENNWSEKRTMIMVSHTFNHIRKYCPRTLYIKNGNAVFIGETETAIEMYNNDNQ